MARSSPHAATIDQARDIFGRGDRAAALALLAPLVTGRDESVEALALAGAIRMEAGETAAGLALLERAHKRAPGDPSVALDLALAYRRAKRWRDAIPPLRSALVKAPGHLAIAVNLAELLVLADDPQGAVTLVERTEKMVGGHPALLYIKADAFLKMNKLRDAERCAQEGRARYPAAGEFRLVLGAIAVRYRLNEEALALVEPVLAAEPHNFEALWIAANAFYNVERMEDVLAVARQAPKDHPMFRLMDEKALDAAWYGCLFDEMERRLALPLDGEEATPRQAPLTLCHVADDPAGMREAADRFTQGLPARPFVKMRRRAAGERIRVGFLSSDFLQHAVGLVAIDFFEALDRSRVEAIGLSLGVEDMSPMRQRFMGAFERFVDLRLPDEQAITDAVNKAGVDVLVDMNGHTLGSRPRVVARAKAPIKAGWLGYPGTFGGGHCDYVIADRFTVPDIDLAQFSERVVRLPETYQPAAARVVSPQPTDRAAHGLPENAFVFASFNDTRKITRQTLEAWARILLATPGSVLWLRIKNGMAERAIVERLAAAGVDRARIVVAGNIALPDHYARQTLADLALDTFPYTGHTITSDALYVGLPVLTRPGIGMASRVAASFVALHGFPELIAEDEEDYVRKAVAYARDPEGTRALARRIREAVPTSKLFDAKRFARHMEGAFETMVAIAEKGEKPRSFDVAPID